jgi:hypothetical protein
MRCTEDVELEHDALKRFSTPPASPMASAKLEAGVCTVAELVTLPVPLQPSLTYCRCLLGAIKWAGVETPNRALEFVLQCIYYMLVCAN